MRAEIVIIGSGMGGASYAAALAPTGRRIAILERGTHLKGDGKDRDAVAIFRDAYFRPKERWLDDKGTPFRAGNYYMVGGNSKLYGASLIRFRAEDFEARTHLGGWSNGWPICYEHLETFYGDAERLFQVRGASDARGDYSDPRRSSDFPFPPVPHEADIEWLKDKFQQQGLRPSCIPLGIDLDAWLRGGLTPWDAYPNAGQGKMDAETCALREALKYPNVELYTNYRVQKLVHGIGETIESALVETPTGFERVYGDTFILAAGAVQSAALLLQSASEDWPNGLANRSDQVGRNFMNHNASAIIAFHPGRRNRCVYQKTLMVNDFYHNGPNNDGPLGNIQMLGKISGKILRASAPWLGPLAGWIARRSFDFYAMSEDLPDPDSRITVRDERIVMNWKRTNWEAHGALVREFSKVLKRAGFPIVLNQAFDHRTPSHQCGTARMGLDPRSSVVNVFGQSHDHRNLIIADASVLPTSAALNPALTIAALSLRSAQAFIQGKLAS